MRIRLLFWATATLGLALELVPAQAQPSDPGAPEPPQAEPAGRNNLGMEFVRLPAGEYRRGFDRGEPNEFELLHRYSTEPNTNREGPAHRVVLTRPFEVARTEVTVGQFRRFVQATGYVTDAEKNGGGYGFFPEETFYVDRFAQAENVTWRTPGFDQTDRHPVVVVSWNDAQAFCKWLSQQEGRTYRLPTEAEWEYACRAGSPDWYAWGKDPDGAYVHGNVADATLEARFEGTTRYQRAVRLEPGDGDGVVFTAPVASYRASAWGLFDMHGNVWEWCQDRWSDDTYERQLLGLSRREWTQVGVTDPFFDTETSQHEYGDWRVLRGGAWTTAPLSVRASIRTFLEAGDGFVYTGFRVVRDVE